MAVDVYQRELTFVSVVVIMVGDEWASGEPGLDFAEVGLVWFSSVTWMLDNVHAVQVQEKSAPMLWFPINVLVTVLVHSATIPCFYMFATLQ